MGGILTILAALIPFVIWLWKRRAARKDDPRTQHEERLTQIDRAIAKSDGDSVNRQLDDSLQRLRDSEGDLGGQSGGANASGAIVHPAESGVLRAGREDEGDPGAALAAAIEADIARSDTKPEGVKPSH